LSEFEIEDLNTNLQIFLNYAIKRKEFSFTVSEMTSQLNLTMTPSVFGKLLNANLDRLEKEGLHIDLKRGADGRIYNAKYEEPFDENM